MNRNLMRRAATGLVFVAVLVGSVWFGPYTFAGLFFIISLLGLGEFYSLAAKGGVFPARPWGLLAGAGVYILNVAVFTGLSSSRILTLQLPLFILLFIVELFRKKIPSTANAMFAAGGIFYIVLGLVCFVATGFISGEYNYQLPLGFLVLLWFSDTGAYLIGSVFGRHRMLERISPKKTWEGFFGGLLVSLSVAAQLDRFFPLMNSLQWMGLALVIVIFGTLGDFVESMFKRNVDVKDSGNLLPGHGGLLDRFDSLLLAGPFGYAFLVLVVFS